MNQLVAILQELVEAAAGCNFNSCLLNLYRSGQDSQSYHSDNEKEYGENPTIASLTLGCPRDFILRRDSAHADKIVFSLGNGDLLIMKGTVQKYWMHAVPKRAGVITERINLTFRNVIFPQK